ncbi:hypothetical protein ACSBR1_026392 [Camellia fascicularis]
MHMKQVTRPELTGALGARLFDEAVMYKSTSIAEPVYLEFPEFKGNSRRDYWLDVCLEILHAHRFIKKYNLKGIQQSEALARAILEQWEDVDGEAFDAAVDVCIGEINPLENAVKQSKRNAGMAEAAQATVDQVKVEGIDTNLAVMKELLFRLIESFNRLQVLATWQDPWKSTMFLVMISYSIFR